MLAAQGVCAGLQAGDTCVQAGRAGRLLRVQLEARPLPAAHPAQGRLHQCELHSLTLQCTCMLPLQSSLGLIAQNLSRLTHQMRHC
jgi:hypothetical protein